MSEKTVMLLDNEDSRRMIRKICEENGIVFTEFENLVRICVGQTSKKKGDLWDLYDNVLDLIQDEKTEE